MGAYVCVCKVASPKGEVLAKRVMFDDPGAERLSIAEVDVLSLVRTHPVICKFRGFTLVDEYALYPELLTEGTLTEIFGNVQAGRPPAAWDATMKATAIYGIAAEIMHLHAHGVVHRRLKPSDILFDRDCEVRITDFAWSRALDRSRVTTIRNEGAHSAPRQSRRGTG